MTTIYIEELFSDDDIEENNNGSIEESDIVGYCHHDQNVNKEDATTPALKTVHENLKNCPIPAGGASFSIVEGKGYAFGGCSRTGKPSSSIHCYSFGKYVVY